MSADCSFNSDPLRLVREGTSQDQRFSAALDPGYAQVDERGPAHGMVFARAYAEFLKYYDSNNVEVDNWLPFFSEDVSVQLAGAAVEDVTHYRQQVKEYAAFLNNRQNESDKAGLRDRLDYLFSWCATLAIHLNRFTEQLPEEIAFRNALRQLVQNQLAPALKRLIAYHKGGETIVDAERPLNDGPNEKAAPLRHLGEDAVRWSTLARSNLSKDWTEGVDWGGYYSAVVADASVYGSKPVMTIFERVNHLATHNLFTSAFEQFLKAYARTVSEAELALERTLTDWDRHEPHYALFLAFLRLFEHARAEANQLTGRHLNFYYRNVLQLKERHAEPGHAHLLMELAKHAGMFEIKAGTLFRAGKDDLGREAYFANDRDVAVNQAKVAALKTVYRYVKEPHATGETNDPEVGRLYASPVSNSDDGLGAPLSKVDQSWHPFHNKIYVDGSLKEVRMPEAEVGFAIASHYLLMAEGERTITVHFKLRAGLAEMSDGMPDVVCRLTSEKGWIEKPDSEFVQDNGGLRLTVKLSGEDPSVTPYAAKTHGHDFPTNLPMLLATLQHQKDKAYRYSSVQDAVVDQITLSVQVEGLKTLAVSNDFGAVDTAKPFQPFGPSPKKESALVIGSKEMFQKTLHDPSIHIKWSPETMTYTSAPTLRIEFLSRGRWELSNLPAIGVGSTSLNLTNDINRTTVNEPDSASNEFYSTDSRYGFMRLVLDAGIGQEEHQAALVRYLRKEPTNAADPGGPPVGPSMIALSANYSASQPIALDSPNASNPDGLGRRTARFFHVAPFGQAEQHPALSGGSAVYLVPRFAFDRGGVTNHSEAELYIGVSGLKPPQSLAVLFQVADGTADPLTQKPDPHLHWSYLSANKWKVFDKSDVDDKTGGLLNSGTVTFAMPRDASDSNTLFPSGMHWIRAAVVSESDAVCRLIRVAAQVLRATFTDKKNDPAFAAKALAAGTISKLDQPNAAVKTITQPFTTFGGRGAEAPTAFYTRISERLRHKDRAIALWDYERLILEAFPQIYRAKCLNHTQYEPTENGLGMYKELAPGHVTVVIIPNQQFQNLRDPLRPYTSLGLLEEIARFLRKRLSCFVSLHVKNPQFEEVQVSCKVRLHDGVDEAFYENKLREAITRFLSPWAFPGGGHPSFSGKIYKSVLINFVEEQSYVDYVTDFQLFHVFVDGDGVQQKNERNDLESSKAVSILVSVPAGHHAVQVI